jgi:hypothetical protein
MLLGVEKAKMSPQSPKPEFGAQNLHGRVICLSIGSLNVHSFEMLTCLLISK